MHQIKSLALVALALAASSAFASPVGAISYGDNVTPSGVIYGTGGNLNGDFTTARVSTSGLELGLRARVRFQTDTMDQGNGTYGGFAASSGPLALWNFDWSVNSNYNGNGTNLAGVAGAAPGLTYLLGMDFDPAVGNTITSIFNLSTTCIDSQFGNNGTASNSGVAANCALGDYATLMAGNNVMQNSGNLGWFTPPAGQSFDPSVPGEYTFFLRAVNAAGEIVGETDITVDVPEPASLALVSLALLGLGVTSRRRKTEH